MMMVMRMLMVMMVMMMVMVMAQVNDRLIEAVDQVEAFEPELIIVSAGMSSS
jgi:hypothetical protein